MVEEEGMRYPKPPEGEGWYYTVQPGDSMYAIALRFGIDLQALIAANPQVKDPDLIYPGQVLLIPFPQPSGCSGYLYRVRSGDTLYKIAKRFGIPLRRLIAANPQIKDPDKIYPGQKICVPVAVEE
ncbi:MAG: SafA/ExsA family spore coat assembly protein [Firmicutes bacterium]|nr:SafA/ExsA family spore coat assembly protein [Bacillota bacterium]